VLLTNRMGWTAKQVVAGYAGQQQVERVFRGLKDGDWFGWSSMYHWTDCKIRIHAFYCLLDISLLQYVQPTGENRPGRSFCREAQQALAKALKLGELQITQRG